MSVLALASLIKRAMFMVMAEIPTPTLYYNIIYHVVICWERCVFITIRTHIKQYLMLY